MNRKKQLVIAIVALVMLLIVIIVISINTNKSNEIISSIPENNPTPVAILEGEVAKEFYEAQSYTNYNATRYQLGDFLINQEKTGENNVTIVTIISFDSDYGDSATYVTNVSFKSEDNGKRYKAKIVNFLDDSQSSIFIIDGYNYEKTFGDVIK